MNISQTCKLCSSLAFSYDIKSCDNSVLSALGYDVSSLSSDDKKERVKKVGLYYKAHPDICKKVKDTVKKIIHAYQEQIGEENVLCTQYDGFICTIQLFDCKKELVPIELRDVFSPFIIAINRKSYIAWAKSDNKAVVKGVPYYYNALDKYYEKLLKIDFGSLQSVFSTLHYLKSMLLSSEDVNLFKIPVDQNKCLIHFKNMKAEVTDSMTPYIDHTEIDKKWYWDHYFVRFVKSILVHTTTGF